MNTTKLKSFAPKVRVQLMESVSRKLDYVLGAETADLLAAATQVSSLRRQAELDRDGLVERVAYTWFNRLAALRFLDARGWHSFHMKVLMPATAEEQQPELLKEMRRTALPEELRPFVDLAKLNDLLDGRLQPSVPGADPQGEVYRTLVLAACRYYHSIMPFLFEAVDDETELLLPDDLLTATSVAQGFREAIQDQDCEQVEVLGWLYQFYISEKKDKVMARKKAVPTEDVPAVTQLFTPHWIVKYLVQNSLGRLWLRSKPTSDLRKHMEYYVPDDGNAGASHAEGVGQNAGVTVSSPEEIRLMDPACGSGHMLTYAFDLLAEIYAEEGYAPTDIPRLILEHNLYGLEICSRAAALASFALVMKARELDRRFFQRLGRDSGVLSPHIHTLRPVPFTPGMLNHLQHVALANALDVLEEEQGTPEQSSIWKAYAKETKKKHKTQPHGELFSRLQDAFAEVRTPERLQSLLQQSAAKGRKKKPKFLDLFEDPEALQAYLFSLVQPRADWVAERAEEMANWELFGSLVRPDPDWVALLRERCGQLDAHDTEEAAERKTMEQALAQLNLLERRYHVVVANPPYMGGKGMNKDLSLYAKDQYPRSKSDLFAMFIERGFDLVDEGGFNAMVTMQSWMFLSSYEEMRKQLFETSTIIGMTHMANMVMGIAFGTAATIWEKGCKPEYKGAFCFVEYEDIGVNNQPKSFPPPNKRNLKANTGRTI